MSKPKEKIVLCNPYFWEDPRYLFTSWLSSRQTCRSEVLNSIVFIYVVSLLIGWTLSSYYQISNGPLIALLLATLFLIPTFCKLKAIEGFRSDITLENEENKEEEGFVEKRVDFNQTGTAGNASFQNQTVSGVRNPFGNVSMDELPSGKKEHDSIAPKRPAASDITSTEAKIALDDFFRVNWYNDPTDVFGKTQSQRMFITQPSTTIPNDQGSYQDWLYKIPGKTCKEGNPDACYGGTDGGALPWLNM